MGFLVNISTILAGDLAPEIKDGKVVFQSGTFIKFGEKRLFEDPEEALEKGLPVIVSSKPIIVHEWQRVLLVTKQQYFEGGNTVLRIFNFDGDTVSPIMTFWGDITLLKTQKRMLLGPDLGDKSKTFIVDINGSMLARIDHKNYLYRFDTSEDEKIFWAISFKMKDRIPFSVLDVYEFNGVSLFKKEFRKAINYIYDHEGVKYPIQIPEPDIPG